MDAKGNAPIVEQCQSFLMSFLSGRKAEYFSLLLRARFYIIGTLKARCSGGRIYELAGGWGGIPVGSRDLHEYRFRHYR
jgi:hypothetical protein